MSSENRDRVIVVGFDAWTEPVITELEQSPVDFVVVTNDVSVVPGLEERGIEVVGSERMSRDVFLKAGIKDADAVLVATLDDHQNLLAVLTVSGIDESIPITSFAAEDRDVSKLKQAGADTVVNLGVIVGELIADAAISGEDIDELLEQALTELTM